MHRELFNRRNEESDMNASVVGLDIMILDSTRSAMNYPARNKNDAIRSDSLYLMV